MLPLVVLAWLLFVQDPSVESAPLELPPVARCTRLAWNDGRIAAAYGLNVIEVVEPTTLVRAYNADPPATDLRPDKVFVIRRAGSAGVVVFIVGDCIVADFPVTPAVLALIEGNPT